MDAESPNKFAEIVDSSDDSSDDENVPLAMFRPALQKSTEEPAFEEPEARTIRFWHADIYSNEDN